MSGVEGVLEQAPRAPLVAGGDGVIRVSGTRVTLETIAQAFADGATAEEIGQQYPTLPLADIYSVIGHILHHSREVAEYLAKREEVRARVRNENEGRFNPDGVRARLMARMPQTSK